MLKARYHFDSVEEALGPTRQAAIRLLARREFGLVELTERLFSKGFPKEAVEITITWLKDKDLQSDERFVEVFIRSKKARGQGPVRIRAELQQLSIADELIAEGLDDGEDWVSLARQVRKKRFGAMKKMTNEERAQQQRFLYYRGFSIEHINGALELVES